MNRLVCPHLSHDNSFPIPFNLFKSKSGAIKVYEPEIVCASQIRLIESFNLAVIKKSVYACSHNYNMQMRPLLP